MNQADLREAAAFYRSAALCGETVTGEEYAETFDLDPSVAQRYWNALVEIDTYLAHDPLVWRVLSVAKAGEVLCDVLGAEVIQRINAEARAAGCPYCTMEWGTPPFDYAGAAEFVALTDQHKEAEAPNDQD